MNPPQKPAFSPSYDALTSSIYLEMHRYAQRERRNAGFQLTLQTTAIIHEAYIKLANKEDWQSREHFLANASTAMRHILVDAARARLTSKRGNGQRPIPLTLIPEPILAGKTAPASDEEISKLGDALDELAKLDKELAQLVECRFFAGMTEAETALIMGISDRTVRRKWIQARAFIHREMTSETE